MRSLFTHPPNKPGIAQALCEFEAEAKGTPEVPPNVCVGNSFAACVLDSDRS